METITEIELYNEIKRIRYTAQYYQTVIDNFKNKRSNRAYLKVQNAKEKLDELQLEYEQVQQLLTQYK